MEPIRMSTREHGTERSGKIRFPISGIVMQECAKGPTLRRLVADDARDLCAFYNGLSAGAIKMFQPLGKETSVKCCRAIAEDNRSKIDSRFDVVALIGDRIVGWAFLSKIRDLADEKSFGIAVADAWQGRGIGKKLIENVLRAATQRELKRIHLIFVVDNDRARRLYERNGFSITGTTSGPDNLQYYEMVKEIE